MREPCIDWLIHDSVHRTAPVDPSAGHVRTLLPLTNNPKLPEHAILGILFAHLGLGPVQVSGSVCFLFLNCLMTVCFFRTFMSFPSTHPHHRSDGFFIYEIDNCSGLKVNSCAINYVHISNNNILPLVVSSLRLRSWVPQSYSSPFESFGALSSPVTAPTDSEAHIYLDSDPQKPIKLNSKKFNSQLGLNSGVPSNFDDRLLPFFASRCLSWFPRTRWSPTFPGHGNYHSCLNLTSGSACRGCEARVCHGVSTSACENKIWKRQGIGLLTTVAPSLLNLCLAAKVCMLRNRCISNLPAVKSTHFLQNICLDSWGFLDP